MAKIQKHNHNLQGKYVVKGSQLIGENHSFYILKRKSGITKDKAPNYLLFKNPSKYCSSIYPSTKHEWQQQCTRGKVEYFNPDSTEVLKYELEYQGRVYSFTYYPLEKAAEIK